MRTILCPIDFSEPSRGSLRYATVMAERSGAALTVLTVNDPLLAQAAAMAEGDSSLDRQAREETARFVSDTFDAAPAAPPVRIAIATGTPAVEILRVAGAESAGLIVMSSRGATGLRKLFLGSTTERVLRATPAPVLVTPPGDHGPADFDEIRKRVRRVLVPVDLSEAVNAQLELSLSVATALGASVLLAHVIEPTRTIVPGHAYAALVDRERRDRAEQEIQALAEQRSVTPPIEVLVVLGDPAEEIAKLAGDRQAGLIIMGLHATSSPGARMGSVTYRVLSMTHGLVLAVPPAVSSL